MVEAKESSKNVRKNCTSTLKAKGSLTHLMSNFTFTDTIQCNVCGEILSSSEENCKHKGAEVNIHVFREIGSGLHSLEGVEATNRYKWHALREKVGDDWTKYELLGSIETVRALLDSSWKRVEDLPRQSMSLDAPRAVGEDK